ncbi:hypothetical protein CITRIK5_30038 [Citricoccus sp. K5]|nr:hypothetical protein CITRIK5_30038 [Citricoccus sp. K5]
MEARKGRRGVSDIVNTHNRLVNASRRVKILRAEGAPADVIAEAEREWQEASTARREAGRRAQ